MMTRKFVQLAMVAAGLTLSLASVTACSDDSTATAPITSNPVTTTSRYASDTSESASPSSTAEAADSTEADDAATSAAVAAGSSLPATAPNSRTTVPQNFPGPDGQPLSDNAKKYLTSLKSQNVTFMGDSDNSVALTMAEYICSEQKKGTDPVTVKAYVTASVGPGTNSVGEANAKADKVIAAAKRDYC